jgi:hypothetical protein
MSSGPARLPLAADRPQLQNFRPQRSEAILSTRHFLLVVGAPAADRSRRGIRPPLPRSRDVCAATTGQNSKLIELTSDQWQFLRGISVMNPEVPAGLPYGEKAVFTLATTLMWAKVNATGLLLWRSLTYAKRSWELHAYDRLFGSARGVDPGPARRAAARTPGRGDGRTGEAAWRGSRYGRSASTNWWAKSSESGWWRSPPVASGSRRACCGSWKPRCAGIGARVPALDTNKALTDARPLPQGELPGGRAVQRQP